MQRFKGPSEENQRRYASHGSLTSVKKRGNSSSSRRVRHSPLRQCVSECLVGTPRPTSGMAGRLSRVVRGRNLNFLYNPHTALLFSPLDAVGLTNVWPCSSVLVKYLDRNDTVQGKHILELGSGCGIVGICAAVLGASSVLLTDKLLNNLQATYSPDGELNEEKASNPAVLLDLIRENVNMNTSALNTTDIRVAELTWGDLSQAQALDLRGATLIIGSDCTFSVPLSASLFKTVRVLLARMQEQEGDGGGGGGGGGSSFIAAHQVRLKASLKSTLALAQEHGLRCRELETISLPSSTSSTSSSSFSASSSAPGSEAEAEAGAGAEGNTFIIWEFTLSP